jgi:DNA-binding NtrC family response regulator
VSTYLPSVHPAVQPIVSVYEPEETFHEVIRKTLQPQYALRIFSDPLAFLEDLNGSARYALTLVAWDDLQRSRQFLGEIRRQRPALPTVVLCSAAGPDDFEYFSQAGVGSILFKPLLPADLTRAVQKHAVTYPAECLETREVQLDATRSFVRASRAMAKIESQAALVAKSDIPVLILGESGTGKEIIAMYTHRMSRRSNRMFLKINCAAMPAELLESEFFGYEQGAFTGAIKTKPGKFEVCDGGTIFLDEIGEMPAVLQAKLLQVLQDGTFSRLGSRTTMKTDVRIIAATNVNLKEAMAKKAFREDLYYRLNGLSLALPPLRERREELPVLAEFFMRKSAEKYGMAALPFSGTLLRAFGQYHWPGNLRELENLVNRYLILQDEEAILSELQPPDMPVPAASAERFTLPENSRNLKHLVSGLKGEAESAMIASVLEETKWNRRAAASDLKISYKALLYKIKQYELSPASAQQAFH